MADDDFIWDFENFHTLSFDAAKGELTRILAAYLGLFPLIKGERPQTDGKRIYLCSSIKDFEDDKDADLYQNRNFTLYRSDLVHELLHITEGTFFADTRGYFETFKNPGLAHALFNTVEDARIEHNGQSYLEESDIRDLRETNEYYARKRRMRESENKEFNKSLGEQVLEIFSCEMIVKHRPSHFAPTARTWELAACNVEVAHPDLVKEGLTTIDDVLVRMNNVSSVIYDEPVQASLSIVPTLYDLLTKAIPDIEDKFPTSNSSFAPVSCPEAPKDDSKGSGAGEGKEGKEESTGSGAKGEGAPGEQMAYTGFRGDVHDFSEAKGKGKTLESLIGPYKPKEPRKQGPESIPTAPPGCGPGGDGKVDSDKVMQVKVYNPDLKLYSHKEPLRLTSYEGRNSAFLTELGKHSSLRHQIVDHFSALQLNKLRRVRRTQQPDEINMEATHELICDPRLRAQARIFDSYRKNRRDSYWLILVDISGSTGCNLGSEERVIDVEKIAAGLLYQGLTDIGDRVELYAFSTGADWHTKTSDDTKLYHLDSLENFGALEPEAANADGVAIRGSIVELNKIHAKEKNLVVISDGRPAASNYYGDPAIADTAMAFQEAEVQGIRTLYFNIDNQAADYFPQLTRPCTYAVSLPSVQKLPHSVMDFVTLFG